MGKLIYKVLSRSLWQSAVEVGHFAGASIDIADGYIHFSTAGQLVETVRRHFVGQDDLVIVSFDADSMGDSLRWEPSRGGALFPHLYSSLPTALAIDVIALPLGSDGEHKFPAGL